MRRDIGNIGHVQIAGVPDRHEPDDDNEVNYPYLFELLDRLDYQGWIGCEYRPRGDTSAGLEWLRALARYSTRRMIGSSASRRSRAASQSRTSAHHRSSFSTARARVSTRGQGRSSNTAQQHLVELFAIQRPASTAHRRVDPAAPAIAAPVRAAPYPPASVARRRHRAPGSPARRSPAGRRAAGSGHRGSRRHPGSSGAAPAPAAPASRAFLRHHLTRPSSSSTRRRGDQGVVVAPPPVEPLHPVVVEDLLQAVEAPVRQQCVAPDAR
ncbi:TIM barrel protein [Pseudomonas aeruginosa]